LTPLPENALHSMY